MLHDLRPVNNFIRFLKMCHPRVRNVLDHGGNVATKFDLRAAFRHVAVAERDRPYIAFSINGYCLRWTCLPFGLSASPALFGRALQPALDEARHAGIAFEAYVDDFIVVAEDARTLDVQVRKLIRILTDRGWNIACDKSYPFAHDRIIFLGLLVDLRERALHVPLSKATKLRDLCAEALASRRIRVSLLQKITGLLSFFLEAVPIIGAAWTRRTVGCLE